MSNVIQFLEAMGKDATLSTMSPEEYTAAVNALNADDQAQHALLNRDQNALNNFLGGRTKMMMMLAPAEDDNEGEGKGNDDDDKKEEEISVH
jgi:hypothetical protein